MAVIISNIIIKVQHIDPLKFDSEALIVPINSFGLMSEGLALRIKEAAGFNIEEEVMRSVPIAVGAAVATQGGVLSVPRLIHVPVIEQPGDRIVIENIRRAAHAGLLGAEHFRLEHIAIPGIGYGENGIPYDETARAIYDEIRAFRGNLPLKVTLVDQEPEMVQAFRAVQKAK